MIGQALLSLLREFGIGLGFAILVAVLVCLIARAERHLPPSGMERQ